MQPADGSHRLLGVANLYGRQECQLGGLQYGLVRLYVQGRVQQVGVLLQTLFDECLQLWVGEHLAPGQVAEGGSVLYDQRVSV